MNIKNFEGIAPYLNDPFVLIGFITFLVISVLFAISKSKYFVKITGEDTARIIKKILNFVFVIVIIVVILGFGYQTYKIYLSNKNSTEKVVIVKAPTEEVDFLESGIRNYKTEKYYDAIRDLKIAVQKENNVGKSYYYIGMSYHFLSKDNEACSYLQKAKLNNYDYDPVDFCN